MRTRYGFGLSIVSIHAPTQGTAISSLLPSGVSIHAPTQGATSARTDFQEICRVSIHAPAGARLYIRQQNSNSAYVSIHAPTQGATVSGNLICRLSSSFKSTRPRRRDAADIANGVYGGTFQSRARAGRDSEITESLLWRPCFNPRAHAGRDVLTPINLYFANIVSITRTQGATTWGFHVSGITFCFNPRAHAGRDKSCCGHVTLGDVFQSTRPRRARLSRTQ